MEIQQGEDCMATIPTTLSEPILVANLPLPPEVAKEAEEICRSRRYTPRERAAVEEDLKLRYHYAGRFVMATVGPHGLQIHAIDLDNPDRVYELRKQLRAQGYRYILSLFPTAWDEPNDQIITLNPVS
jgi:hypothetical protein